MAGKQSLRAWQVSEEPAFCLGWRTLGWGGGGVVSESPGLGVIKQVHDSKKTSASTAEWARGETRC